MGKKYCIFKLLLIATVLLIVLSYATAESVLETILAEAGMAREEGKLPVIIFDLDGTLFATGFRSKRIFLEYALEIGDSALAMKVNSMDPLTMKYRVRESLAESGITDSTVLNAMTGLWSEKFFSDDYLKYDEHLPGSARFVSALHDSGALIIYLTGRDATGMLRGTITSLAEHGFPIGEVRTELIMKPERYMNTHPFKKDALTYIEKLGTVIAIFENEPEYVNLLSERFPGATACFVTTQHKPNAPPVSETAHHLAHYLVNLPLKPTEGQMMER